MHIRSAQMLTALVSLLPLSISARRTTSTATEKLTVSVSGPLEECVPATISWTPPDLLKLKTQGGWVEPPVYTLVPIVSLPGNATLSAESSHLFDTMKLTKKWAVDYPRGTEIVFEVGVWVPGEGDDEIYFSGRSNAFTVSAGNSSCIPSTHYPIDVTIAPSKDLAPCSATDIVWSGGEPPYVVSVDSQHPYIHRQTLVLTNSTIYTWRINFPHDSLLRLSVSDRRGYFAGARTSLVRRISASTSSSNERCVPRAHQFHPRWWTSTVAIMLFSATALVLVFGVIMVAGTVWLNKRRQRNEERQQLLEDSD